MFEATNQKVDDAMLFDAIVVRNYDMLKYLLEHGANPTSDVVGYAIEYDECEAVNILLKHGADPNGSYEHANLLEYAVISNSYGSMYRLIEHGADINAFPVIEDTFSENDDFSFVEHLINSGAKVPDEEFWIKFIDRLSPKNIRFLRDNGLKSCEKLIEAMCERLRSL